MPKAITQKDSMGCSIACVAFVCGKSYDSAKKQFKNAGRAKTNGFICKEIVESLARAGKSYKYNYIKRKSKWKEGTIVFIKRSKRYPAGHFLARAADGWMDPWIDWSECQDIRKAKAGFRKRLPGTPIYKIYINKPR